MIKKFFLLIIFLIITSSCGKKGDPEFNKKITNSIKQYQLI
tara:strand:+ start:1349 stop:1471 length:123 start_codon:yes stop_codon:yes gene_type:complete